MAAGGGRRTLAFFAVFAVAIGAYALLAWRMELLAEPWRPFARTALWGGTALALVWMLKPLRPWRWLGLVPITPRIVGFTLMAFAVVMALQALRAFGLEAPVGQLAAISAAALLASAVGVFVEELVFRGAMQPALVAAWGAWLGVIATAVLFLAIHAPGWLILEITPPPSQVAGVFVVGLICGVLREATGSLWPAFAAHWANNLGVWI